MAEKNFHVRRKLGLDPRMFVKGDFGEYAWIKYDEEHAIWSFETESARFRFIKKYGGEEFTMAIPPVRYYDPPPDYDFAWTRKPRC